MTAPPEVIYAAVNDFHRWQEWSPWEKLDPAMTKKHEGPASGNGAIYSWKGNDQVGEGRMTNLGGKLNEHIDIKLEFIAPWEATNETSFDIKPVATNTEVTWTMTAHNNFAPRPPVCS